jgi:hypothetical protein
MAIFSKMLSVLVTAAVVAAQHDTGAHLNKPSLHDNLDYLKPGLIASLPETKYKIDQWGAGWIPQGCKNIAEGKVESSVTYNPADFNIFNVHYSDVCVSGWYCDSFTNFDTVWRCLGLLPPQELSHHHRLHG